LKPGHTVRSAQDFYAGEDLLDEHAKMFAPLGCFRGLNDEQFAAVAQRGNWDRVGFPTIGIAAHGITRIAQS
jgi:hypothetical protein